MLIRQTTRPTIATLVSGAALMCLSNIGQVEAKMPSPVQVASRESAHCQAPQWSPDGKLLAIGVYNPKGESEAREAWVLRLDSSLTVTKEEQVLPLGSKRSRLSGQKMPPVIEFSWTPDMEMLNPPYVFSSQGLHRKNFDIYADGSWITEANSGNDGQPTFSPDSNYLAYTSQQRESGDIMMIDYTGDIEQPIKLTDTPDTTEYLPQWHPKQAKLLFIRSQKTRGQDIVVIEDVKNPKGSTRDITDWKGDEIRPHWSPDGSLIAFYSNEKSKNDKVFDLWVIRADGSDAKLLAKDVIVDDHKGPAWSGDSETIFFVTRDYERSNPIMWVSADGKKKGTVTSETLINSDLDAYHAPDGTISLAYRSPGKKGSAKMTWQNIFVLRFKKSDLK